MPHLNEVEAIPCPVERADQAVNSVAGKTEDSLDTPSRKLLPEKSLTDFAILHLALDTFGGSAARAGWPGTA
jgi:hypothetical protein